MTNQEKIIIAAAVLLMAGCVTIDHARDACIREVLLAPNSDSDQRNQGVRACYRIAVHLRNEGTRWKR